MELKGKFMIQVTIRVKKRFKSIGNLNRYDYTDDYFKIKL
jgi:hypothetical protein